MPSFKEYRLPQFTSISDLKLATVDKVPEPSAGQVLVKIHAVSLNYRDLLIAENKYPMDLKDNVVPCSDGAGIVTAIGAGVQDFKVGDRVIGIFNQEHLEGDTVNDRSFKSGLGGALDGVLTEYRVFRSTVWCTSLHQCPMKRLPRYHVQQLPPGTLCTVEESLSCLDRLYYCRVLEE